MKRTILTGMAAVVLLLAVLTAGYVLVPRLNLPQFRLSSTTTTVSSQGVLESIRDIARLQTVSGVYRVVFPHDFYSKTETTRTILDKITRSGEDSLTTGERCHLMAYNLSQEAGLALTRDSREFVVMTLVAVAGYNLNEPPFQGLPADQLFRRAGEDAPAAMFLPDAVILSTQIEDMNRENYTYPAVSLTPEEIRSISTFIRSNALSLPEIEMLKQAARIQAKEVFSRLLGENDPASVNFSREPLATVQ